MVEWKTRMVWLLYIFGYCFLVGIIKLFKEDLIWGTSIGFKIGSALGTSIVIFGMGTFIALIAAGATGFSKENTKIVYIAWAVGSVLVSLSTIF
jgi:hypothetical protein